MHLHERHLCIACMFTFHLHVKPYPPTSMKRSSFSPLYNITYDLLLLITSPFQRPLLQLVTSPPLASMHAYLPPLAPAIQCHFPTANLPDQTALLPLLMPRFLPLYAEPCSYHRLTHLPHHLTAHLSQHLTAPCSHHGREVTFCYEE